MAKAAADALDMMARYSFTLPDVAEDITGALAAAHPKVREGTLAWLATCVSRETRGSMMKLLAAVIPAAAKCTDDGAPAIREAAMAFLVQAALKVSMGVHSWVGVGGGAAAHGGGRRRGLGTERAGLDEIEWIT